MRLLLLFLAAVTMLATPFGTVQIVAPGPGFLVTPAPSITGSTDFYAGPGFPFPGQPFYPTTTLSYSGSATASSGILKAGISMSASSIYQSPSFTPRVWQGASGAAIAEWDDIWTIASPAIVNGVLRLSFAITGTGPGSLTIYGPSFPAQEFQLFPTTNTFSVPITTGVGTEIRVRLTAGGAGIGMPPGGFSSDYRNTVILTGVSVTDGVNPVSYSMTTQSQDPFFNQFLGDAGVPEPGTFATAAVALLALGVLRRRR